MTAPKVKMKTIVMPVGVDSGKKMKFPVDQADRIIRDFGEWNGESAVPSAIDGDKLMELEKALSEAVAKIGELEESLTDETTRANDAEKKIVELDGQITTLTNPDGAAK